MFKGTFDARISNAISPSDIHITWPVPREENRGEGVGRLIDEETVGERMGERGKVGRWVRGERWARRWVLAEDGFFDLSTHLAKERRTNEPTYCPVATATHLLPPIAVLIRHGWENGIVRSASNSSSFPNAPVLIWYDRQWRKKRVLREDELYIMRGVRWERVCMLFCYLSRYGLACCFTNREILLFLIFFHTSIIFSFQLDLIERMKGYQRGWKGVWEGVSQ